MQPDKDLVFWVIVSTVFGLSTSSIISVKKSSTIGQLLLAAALACVLSAASPFFFMAIGWHFAWAIPASALLGLLVYGIFAWADVTEKKLPSINVWDVWKYLPQRPSENPVGNPPSQVGPKPDNSGGSSQP